MEHKKIPKRLVGKTLEWLNYDGVAFFEMCLEEYGTILATWTVLLPGELKHSPFPKAVRIAKKRYGIPHTVHFREGMAVRNFLRGLEFCKDWTSYQLDDRWSEVVLAALQLCEENRTKEV